MTEEEEEERHLSRVILANRQAIRRITAPMSWRYYAPTALVWEVLSIIDVVRAVREDPVNWKSWVGALVWQGLALAHAALGLRSWRFHRDLEVVEAAERLELRARFDQGESR